MNAEISWTHPIEVAALPEEGADFELAPDDVSRAALARYVDALAIPALTARLNVRPDGRGGATVHGDLQATVRQTCVVTLEPFDNSVREEIAMRFAPAGSMPAAESNLPLDPESGDPPDPIVNGVIDLARIVTEFLALGVDPYPRKPGAVFEPPAENAQPAASPFAALEKLKDRGKA